MKYIISIGLLALLLITACQLPQQKKYLGPDDRETTVSDDIDIDVSESAVIPGDGSAPLAGEAPAEEPDEIVTFTQVGEKFEVKKGQTVNFIYDGIDPEETYIIYESTWDGYSLELAYRDEPVELGFSRLCQIYIVASPRLTTLDIPEEMKYEQVVWTPRADGSWEVRIGTTQRGCKSKALDNLNKLRTKKYESNVPKR